MHKLLRLLGVCLMVCIGMAVPARSATAAGEACPKIAGAKVPVLFVHGFNSGQEIWTNSGFEQRILDNPKISTGKFNYKPYSLQWVTDPNIGKRLAQQILCLATSSRKGGGTGKVIVVAHSMGGLATKQAILEESGVAEALGLVVTIATPNNGSRFDRQATVFARNACNLNPTTAITCRGILEGTLTALTSLPGLSENSPEIRKLPAWPSGLPVYAIAGNISLRYGLGMLELDAPPSGSDALVTVKSALHGQKVGPLGGNFQIRCSGGPPPLLVGLTKAPCEHSALLENATVQEQTAKQIKAYVQHGSRKLPEYCGPVIYRDPSFTLKASVEVTGGVTTCKTALSIGRLFLEKSGPDPITLIGKWRCRSLGADSRGFVADCTSREGKLRLNGE